MEKEDLLRLARISGNLSSIEHFLQCQQKYFISEDSYTFKSIENILKLIIKSSKEIDDIIQKYINKGISNG